MENGNKKKLNKTRVKSSCIGLVKKLFIFYLIEYLGLKVNFSPLTLSISIFDIDLLTNST